MSPRAGLDADKLAKLLKAIKRIYPDMDVVRCQATTYLGEVRFNVTVRDKP